jgi:hypothetical protein
MRSNLHKKKALHKKNQVNQVATAGEELERLKSMTKE